MPASLAPRPTPPPRSPDPHPLVLHVLGRMSVCGGGPEVAVGPPIRRLLLALLVAASHQVVPADVLIEELWGDKPPKNPLAALQSHVSHLRAALPRRPAGGGPDHALRHRAPGYVLLFPPSQVDVHRFERRVHAGQSALREGDARTARACLAEALALWQGSPYLEFDSCARLAQESVRLEQLRLTALENWADACLELGEAEQVVVELDGEVRRHPMRERLAGRLMTALFRMGRQADSLAVYSRTRAYLSEELGVGTGAELRRVHLAILRQEIGPGPTRTPLGKGPRGVPPDGGGDGDGGDDGDGPDRAAGGAEFGVPGPPAPLVGVRPELRRLVNEARGVLDGREHVTCVVGPVGVGKTHLLTEFAALMAVEHRNVEIVTVQAIPGEDVPPYWLWTQVLRRLSTTRSDALRDAAAPPFDAVLGALATGIGPGCPEDRGPTPFLVHDGVCELLRTLAARKPMVICVDDLHWADPASLELLDMLARRRYGGRIGLVVSAWDWKVLGDEGLRRVLPEILSGPRTGVLRLSEPDRAVVDPVPERTGTAPGVPGPRRSSHRCYFAERALLWGACSAESDRGPAGAHCLRSRAGLSESLRPLLARMPERQRALVRLCALLGTQMDLGLLRRLAADEPVDTVLDRLLREGLLRGDQHDPGRVHFVCETVREVLVAGLTGEERRRMRERIAAELSDGDQAATDERGPGAVSCLTIPRRDRPPTSSHSKGESRPSR
ncbi:BTAD domain-containing putative transcriptional regulator (plasmid) [Streptomyces sp. BI20]|uniref:BTAD domain-containing putative transcriptional regulator n=1 Tax=Streptomyces sp. BI20 TaxID=3403460 RepID=UPI003C784CF9